MWGSGIGRAITSLVVSIYMVFYISNPSIYYTDSFLDVELSEEQTNNNISHNLEEDTN